MLINLKGLKNFWKNVEDHFLQSTFNSRQRVLYLKEGGVVRWGAKDWCWYKISRLGAVLWCFLLWEQETLRLAGVDVLCLITSCKRYSCQISPVYYSAIKHLNINELNTMRQENVPASARLNEIQNLAIMWHPWLARRFYIHYVTLIWFISDHINWKTEFCYNFMITFWSS